MESLNYILIVLAASTGLILGRILAWTAKEEIKPGTKYFLILQKALFIILIFSLMYLNRTNVHYIWTGALAIFIYLSWFKKLPSYALSAASGIIIYLASLTEHFLLISAITFLYGFPAGTLIKNKKEIILNTILFLTAAIASYSLLS